MTVRVKWSGVLGKPITLPPLGALLVSPDEVKRKYSEQHAERERALFEHYEIDRSSPSAWSTLAFRLAHDLIPGFAIKRSKPWPGEGWKGMQGVELFADVQQLARAGKSERQACRILGTTKRYAIRYSRKRNLWARYMEVKREHTFLTRFLEGDSERREALITILIEHLALYGATTKPTP